jgi:hypothetical protein
LAIFIRLTATVFKAPLVKTVPSIALWAWKWFSVSRTSTPKRSESFWHTLWANSGWVLTPVPTAVPPRATSVRSSRAFFTRCMPRSIWPAYPVNSWPSRIGVASWRCVRPVFTTSSNSRDFSSSAAWSFSSAGSRSSWMEMRAERWMAVGMTSFEDWPMLT